MIRTVIFSVALALLLIVPNAHADQSELIGEYRIEGWSPGLTDAAKPDYVGKAVLRQWGEVLSYRGFMDEMTYAGAGIYDEEAKTLSLSFTNADGSERGVTLLKVMDGNLAGIWVMDNGGGGKPGKEVWTKK